MAIVDRDIVALGYDPNVQRYTPQPLRFGIVQDRGGITVLWENGLLETGMAAAALDKIMDWAGGAQYVGKVVGINPALRAGAQVRSRSPAAAGVVVSVYQREGLGPWALVRLFNGTWCEVQPTTTGLNDPQFEILENR